MIRQLIFTALVIGMLSIGVSGSTGQFVPQPRISYVTDDRSLRYSHKRRRSGLTQRRRLVYG